MNEEDVKEGVEKLKSAKRWWDRFAADHPRLMWAWALIASAMWAFAWIGNKIAC